MRSAVYQQAFWIVAVTYFLVFEFYFRLSPAGHGSFTVIWAWLAKGNARILLSVVWMITTVAFVALASDYLRNIFIGVTARPDTYVFLGDKLREGMYVARENDPERKPVFAGAFVVRNQHPNASFAPLYDRKIMLQDREGSLTPAEMLATRQLALFSFIQLVLLLFSALCAIAVVDQFVSGFPGVNHLQDLARATTLPGTYKMIFISLILLFYAGGVAITSYNMRAVGNSHGKVLPLPPAVAPGAVLTGTVVASEDFEIDNSGRSQNEARFYRRYAIRFDGPGFPLPVYVNWWKQRMHQGNVSVAGRRLKKERLAHKEYYDQVFARLDQAMASGDRMKFRVDEELDISPHIETLGKAPDEDEE